MTTFVWRLACLLAITSFTFGCTETGSRSGDSQGGKGTKRLVFVTNGDDPFWDALLSGLNEGAKQSKLAEAGLSVKRDVNNGTAEGQIEKQRQYATHDDNVGVAISVFLAVFV